MRVSSRMVGTALLLLLAVGACAAQRRRDPLTQAEVDQIRDTSWEPKLRLPLYLQFARARLVKLEQVRSDPKTKDPAQQTHDLLDDFQRLYDELNDNIDTYVDRRDDIRKPLKLVIDADNEFQAKLRALKDADVTPAESQQYEFVLTNALETVDSATEDHKKLLSDQEEQAKHKKLITNPTEKVGSSKPE